VIESSISTEEIIVAEVLMSSSITALHLHHTHSVHSLLTTNT
jgi:hypothetical protein